MTRPLSIGVLLAVAIGCAGGGKEQAIRSPSYDYPADGPWGPTTADGDSVGADRMSVGDKLRTGPTIGNQGVRGPEYPAAEEEEEERPGPEPEPETQPEQESE